MNFECRRDKNPAQKHNWGQFFVEDMLLGQTLEDEDRFLEDGGVKVYGETAIPRGKYKIVLAFSPHFNKQMPHLLNVPQFDQIMVHGGNEEKDTLGCILLGHLRTEEGIRDCAGVVQRLIDLLESAAARDEDCWIDVT